VIQLAPETADALATELHDTPAALAIINPGGRGIHIYRCANTAIGPHECDRTLTVPEAEHLAARIDSANQYNVMALGATMENLPQPLVLVYGMPWERQPEEGEC